MLGLRLCAKLLRLGLELLDASGEAPAFRASRKQIPQTEYGLADNGEHAYCDYINCRRGAGGGSAGV